MRHNVLQEDSTTVVYTPIELVTEDVFGFV